MKKKDYYYNWEIFKNIYLEDSFVLEINEVSNSFVFKVEVVLTENHPLFENPKFGEKYCYKDAFILFSNPTLIRWDLKNLGFVSSDANNESDLGNIDVFYKDENGYYLEGDWGKVLIKSDEVSISYL